MSLLEFLKEIVHFRWCSDTQNTFGNSTLQYEAHR
ncbi:unnamed protein product, partial [Rotaria socialis]